MEVYNAIIQAISTVGFPIVCCLIMFKNNNELSENHKKEIATLKTCIENNTLQVIKLYEKIDILIDRARKEG